MAPDGAGTFQAQLGRAWRSVGAFAVQARLAVLSALDDCPLVELDVPCEVLGRDASVTDAC